MNGVLVVLLALSIGPRDDVRMPQSENRWPDERQVGPFLIHADFSIDEVPEIAPQLSSLQRDLQLQLGVDEPGGEIHLFLFKNPQTYRGYLQAYFPQAPYRRAMFIKGRGPAMVFAQRGKELITDLRHETTHALLHDDLALVPIWLDEGLAECFELLQRDRLNHPYRENIRWQIRLGRLLTLTELEALTKTEQLGTREYQMAWAWVDYLMRDSVTTRGVLLGYLDDLRAHRAVERLSQRLEAQIPDYEKQFRRFHMSPQAATLPTGRLPR